MVLLIDTSSACSAVAVLTEDGDRRGETVAPSGRDFNVREGVRRLVEPDELTRIGVAIGPGSFTGLRVGVAFAVGLAIGRGLPLHGLPSLEISRRRARQPATAVSEAGRGRLYYFAPDGAHGLAEAAAVPDAWPLVGWLRPATAEAVKVSGRRLLDEQELAPFATAAFSVLGESPEVPYGRVKLEYMQPEERDA